MAYHPRIESTTLSSFVTTRSRNSELWFVNNKPLENTVLGFAAKYSERYQAKIYALAIEGNHIQKPMLFPLGNRSSYMRDFNSSVARAIPKYVKNYPGGRFWGRRYSQEFLPGNDDIEEYFFYTVLQPVKDGLVEKISDYPGYNCFHDAVHGIERRFKVVRWAEYNAAKRYNPTLDIRDYTDIVKLAYERLPGYEALTQEEYSKLMHEKLEKRRVAIVKDRLSRGLSFLGRTRLLQTVRGSLPKNSKQSSINSHRPRILSVSDERREHYSTWYFFVYFAYRQASRRFREGDLTVEFPEGTYRPFSSHGLAPPD